MPRIFIGFLILMQGAAVCANPQLIDRIVAFVDSEPILYSEVKSKLSDGPLVKVSPFPVTEKDTPYEQAVNDEINFLIIKRKMAELEIVVSEDDVQQQINKILSQNKKTLSELRLFLESQGRDYETYKRSMKEQMMFMRFRGREIIPRVKITDNDVKDYFVKLRGSTDTVEVSLRQILLRTGNDPELKSKKKEIADIVYSKLQSGMKFLEAEKVYSDQDDARAGRKPRSFKLADLNDNIKIAVQDLKAGQFSKPIDTPIGYMIIQVHDRKLTESKEFFRRKGELERELRAQETTRQTELWLKRERARSKIKILTE